MRELFISYTIFYNNGDTDKGDAVCEMYRNESLSAALMRVKRGVREQIPEASTVIATSVYITPPM